MCDCSTISWWLAGWRAIHFLACLLPVGALAFHLLVAQPVLGDRAPMLRSSRPWVFLALIVALFSGVAWLLLVAADVAETTSLQALHGGLAELMLRRTHFGLVWKIRFVFWAIAIGSSSFMLVSVRRPKMGYWICLISSAGLLGALAWAGHGMSGEDNWANLHLTADAIHLLAGGAWPFGLVWFALTLSALRKNRADWLSDAAVRLTRRFSALALTCVILLTASGLINSTAMLPSFSSLWRTAYGRWLMAKLLLFTLMLAVATYNRSTLPRLSAGPTVEANMIAARLRNNAMFEFALGIGVIAIIALLGTLSPPSH